MRGRGKSTSARNSACNCRTVSLLHDGSCDIDRPARCQKVTNDHAYITDHV